MKKFIMKINEKVSIYYLVIFLLYFLTMCLPFANINFDTSQHQPLWIITSYYIRFDRFDLLKVILVITTIVGILLFYMINKKKKVFANISILLLLIVIPVLSCIDNYIIYSKRINEPYSNDLHIGFYLMLAILIIHTIFTILCFVYKVDKSISNKKPKIKNLNRNNDNGDEFWNNIVEDVAKDNTLNNNQKQGLINDNANENNKPTNKLITINKELILKHKKSIIISTVAVILILILTLSLSLGLSPKIKLTDEMVVRENNTFYTCYIFKFKAENKIPATYYEYDVYCEDDYEIGFYGYSLSQQVINPNDYIYFRLMIPKNLSGKTEISILFKNKEIATRNFSY